MTTMENSVERDVAVLVVHGRLTGGPETVEVHDRVKKILDEGHRKILLDLSDVPWLNSMAAGILAGACASARREKGTLEVCCLSKHVEMVLRTMVLIPELFAGYPTREEALRNLA